MYDIRTQIDYRIRCCIFVHYQTRLHDTYIVQQSLKLSVLTITMYDYIIKLFSPYTEITASVKMLKIK